MVLCTCPYLHIPLYIHWFHSHIPFHNDEISHQAVELTVLQSWNLFVEVKIWNGTVVALDSESEQRSLGALAEPLELLAIHFLSWLYTKKKKDS